jgi:hypothetical protein
MMADISNVPRVAIAGAASLICLLGFAGTKAHALFAGQWVTAPANGVVTAKAGGLGPLAVCRAEFDGGQHPGKLWQGQCHFEWGWDDKVADHFQVLLDDGFSWENPFRLPPAGTLSNEISDIPGNAVDGGDAGNQANHTRLTVCQAFIPQDNTWHPGKFYAGHCNIAWGGPGGNVSHGRKKRAPNANGDVLILVKR